jgi:hypothetical protein
VYHIEIRQFPHNVCRFNLTGGELSAVVVPWVREQAVDFGERKWSPHTARLTILEGERLPSEVMTMGRGWRAAQRESEDVTEQLLASAREALSAQSAQPSPPQAPAGVAQSHTPSDPLALGVQIAALLGGDPMRLLEAWRAAATRAPGLAPAETLALAERDLAAREEDGT